MYIATHSGRTLELTKKDTNNFLHDSRLVGLRETKRFWICSAHKKIIFSKKDGRQVKTKEPKYLLRLDTIWKEEGTL